MSDISTSWFPLLGRILVAVIVAFGMVTQFMTSVGIPFASLALAAALVVKIGGALALILGFRTVWAAWALIVFTILSTAFFHLDLGDQTQLIAFLKNLSIIGALLYIVAYGPGSISIDERKKIPAPSQG